MKVTICKPNSCRRLLVVRTQRLSSGRVRRYRYCPVCGRGKVTVELLQSDLQAIERRSKA